ncbi:uncharacterized protein LOC127793133 [Diospyros lotus]|uniref:uncharacterized protein LOC127793133 n=1 Tax=Diospyros lotus TaxID=55363 RepID=UPI00224DD46F|nr:uncharacterized protein LOC127793133 [Diospyros lotus]
MEEYPSIPMERTGKILRRSIHTFLQNYHYFTTVPTLLAFPFSAAVLLSQALLPFSALLPTVYHRLRSLFQAAGFPPSSEFFSILNIKLSQTITSSILVLPFTLSFLLLAKASIIQALCRHKPTVLPSFASFISTYNHILLTQVCNFFIILSANAACFSVLFIAFNCLQAYGYSSPGSLLFLSATGAVLYSIVLANALIVCNLALVSSGMDKLGGYLAFLKAGILIRGRTATALALALPINLALAAVEALFQFRVVRAYYAARSSSPSTALEGIFIAYLYSIIIVIDTIVSCAFLRSCKTASQMDQEGRCSFQISIEGQDVNHRGSNIKTFQGLP